MAESQVHLSLVRFLSLWVSKNLLNNDSGSIYVDLPETNAYGKPPQIIDQFRPDLFAKMDECLIIGEAKTELDLESRHSKSQFESYIKTCELHEGKSYLVISVPCFVEASAKNLLNQICKRLKANKTEIIVISQFLR